MSSTTERRQTSSRRKTNDRRKSQSPAFEGEDRRNPPVANERRAGKDRRQNNR
jgi:hypothetical protein